MAVSPDDKYLAVYDGKRGLLIWDDGEGRLLHSLEEHYRASPSTVLSMSLDSKYVALANSAGVAIINLATGKREALIDQSPVAQIRWSPEGGPLTLVGAHHFYENKSRRMYNRHLSVTTWDWRKKRQISNFDTTPPQ